MTKMVKMVQMRHTWGMQSCATTPATHQLRTLHHHSTGGEIGLPLVPGSPSVLARAERRLSPG